MRLLAFLSLILMIVMVKNVPNNCQECIEYCSNFSANWVCFWSNNTGRGCYCAVYPYSSLTCGATECSFPFGSPITGQFEKNNPQLKSEKFELE